MPGATSVLTSATGARSLVIGGLLAVVACGGTKNPASLARERQLDEALEALGSASIDGGGARLKKMGGRAVRGELQDGFIVMLDADKCYAIVGLGEDTLQAMSFLVTAPSGAWVAKTNAPERAPVLRLCTKLTGPHRIGVKLKGRGDYVIGLYASKADVAAALGSASSVAGGPSAGPPSARAQPAPAVSALASAPSLPTQTVAPIACADVGSERPFSRAVRGADRGCSSDADCISIKLDCSQLTCSGLNRTQRAFYAAPIDCRGYTGEMGNYDCDPQFGIEAPRCQEGCCVSVRTGP